MEIINRQEEIEKFADTETQTYLFEKSVKFNCSIILDAGWSIKADGSIEAGWYIEAGGYIKAGRYIKAGGHIEAGRYIKAGGHIEAGGYIFSFTFSVSAEFIITRKLPFWREYYAEMPPLKKYKKYILDEKKCWDFYKKIDKKEAERICKWNGWHWLIRAQLEMFFGLKEKYEIEKGK
jgi:hypothetical protein